MRELTVYYCSKCGRYGFYQVSKNAICPVCKTPMTVFPMSYQNFMDMDYNMRDQLISDQIAGNVTLRLYSGLPNRAKHPTAALP